MSNVDRHLAIWSGWVAGPAAGIVMMAAPEYFKTSQEIVEYLFWGGSALFLLSIVVPSILLLRRQREPRVGPIVLIAVGATLILSGLVWMLWPAGSKAAEARPYMTLKEAIQIVPDVDELILYLREGRLTAEGIVEGTEIFVPVPAAAWKFTHVAQRQGNLIFDKEGGSNSFWEKVRFSRKKFREIYPESSDRTVAERSSAPRP